MSVNTYLVEVSDQLGNPLLSRICLTTAGGTITAASCNRTDPAQSFSFDGSHMIGASGYLALGSTGTYMTSSSNSDSLLNLTPAPGTSSLKMMSSSGNRLAIRKNSNGGWSVSSEPWASAITAEYTAIAISTSDFPYGGNTSLVSANTRNYDAVNPLALQTMYVPYIPERGGPTYNISPADTSLTFGQFMGPVIAVLLIVLIIVVLLVVSRNQYRLGSQQYVSPSHVREYRSPSSPDRW